MSERILAAQEIDGRVWCVTKNAAKDRYFLRSEEIDAAGRRYLDDSEEGLLSEQGYADGLWQAILSTLAMAWPKWPKQAKP